VRPSVNSDRRYKPTAKDYLQLIVGTVAICTTYAILAVCMDCRSAVSILRISGCVMAFGISIAGVLVVVSRTVNRRSRSSE
jgi:predicted exporter